MARVNAREIGKPRENVYLRPEGSPGAVIDVIPGHQTHHSVTVHHWAAIISLQHGNDDLYRLCNMDDDHLHHPATGMMRTFIAQ